MSALSNVVSLRQMDSLTAATEWTLEGALTTLCLLFLLFLLEPLEIPDYFKLF